MFERSKPIFWLLQIIVHTDHIIRDQTSLKPSHHITKLQSFQDSLGISWSKKFLRFIPQQINTQCTKLLNNFSTLDKAEHSTVVLKVLQR